MKTPMSKLKFIPLILTTIVAASSCIKTATEEVRFPKTMELLVGQYCLPQVVLDEFEYTDGSSSSYSSSNAGIIINGDTIDWNTNTSTNNSSHKTYIFKKWASDNAEIAITRGDTLMALSSGECELTALYHDKFGDHSANCSVIVSDPVLPSSEDTIFAKIGDAATLCRFDFPGLYDINYELKYSNGAVYQSTLLHRLANHETGFGISPVIFSPVYNYYLITNITEQTFSQGLSTIRIYCDTLGINVTIPIVILPSDESKKP